LLGYSQAQVIVDNKDGAENQWFRQQITTIESAVQIFRKGA
jgi:hypothetical protein